LDQLLHGGGFAEPLAGEGGAPLRLGRPVAEGLQGQQKLVAGARRRRNGCRLLVRGADEKRESFAQVHHQPLRGLLAHAGKLAQARQIAGDDGGGDVAGLAAGEDAEGHARADALHTQQLVKEHLLQLADKAVELDGILANGGMDAQGRLRAHGMARGGGIGAQDQVTDTTHVEHQALGATLHHRAVQPRDHGATSRKRARWMWQMAAASASQACSSPGSFTPSKSATMRLTCSLAARPLPVTARLISEGAYSCTGSSPPVAAKAAPR